MPKHKKTRTRKPIMRTTAKGFLCLALAGVPALSIASLPASATPLEAEKATEQPLKGAVSIPQPRITGGGTPEDVAEWFSSPTIVAVSPEEVARIAAEAEAERLRIEAGAQAERDRIYFEEQKALGLVGWVAPIERYRVASRYGFRDAIPAAGTSAGLHNGLDMAAPMGTPILAAFDGEVVHVGFSDFGGHTGGIVVLKHEVAGEIFLTSYNHMKTSGILVSVGDEVESGEKIASVASEGMSTGPHLHFTVRVQTNENWQKKSWRDLNWDTVDPVEFMATRGIDLL